MNSLFLVNQSSILIDKMYQLQPRNHNSSIMYYGGIVEEWKLNMKSGLRQDFCCFEHKASHSVCEGVAILVLKRYWCSQRKRSVIIDSYHLCQTQFRCQKLSAFQALKFNLLICACIYWESKVPCCVLHLLSCAVRKSHWRFYIGYDVLRCSFTKTCPKSIERIERI